MNVSTQNVDFRQAPRLTIGQTERERQTDRQIERQTETERQRERDRFVITARLPG